jgi:hypothetical protein
MTNESTETCGRMKLPRPQWYCIKLLGEFVVLVVLHRFFSNHPNEVDVAVWRAGARSQ